MGRNPNAEPGGGIRRPAAGAHSPMGLTPPAQSLQMPADVTVDGGPVGPTRWPLYRPLMPTVWVHKNGADPTRADRPRAPAQSLQTALGVTAGTQSGRDAGRSTGRG
jgi:hypothetical protein